MSTGGSESLDQLAPLAEPVRRRLYEFVAASTGPVDRDAAAAGLGIGRPLAAFHLDRLVAAGLLDVEFRRRSGRSGPGAGRPAKFYRRASGPDVAVSLPPRQYDLAAEILADGIDREPAVRGAVLDAARARGAAMARDAATGPESAPVDRPRFMEILRSNGYEPFEDAEGTIRLRNCPFHALVAEHRELTCSMNLALLDAATAVARGTGLHAISDPREGLCCVAFAPTRRDTRRDAGGG